MMKCETAVILAGGKGSRIRDVAQQIPKPMVNIGDTPIILHIMKHLSVYGIKRFIICVGYKGDVIRDYFLNLYNYQSDIQLNFHSQGVDKIVLNPPNNNWEVIVANTGEETNTGGRIKAIQKYVNSEIFLCTYGDGLSDVNVELLVENHLKSNAVATLTSVQIENRFGVVKFDNNKSVIGFSEKPKENYYINGGFFIFSKSIFDFIHENSILEVEVIQKLIADKKLHTYLHHGFWKCMDNYRDWLDLNLIWQKGSAPWLSIK